MKPVACLPDAYKEIYSLDLQNNTKLALFVNILAVVITVVLAIPACFLVPITTFFATESGVFLLKPAILIVGVITYMVLHELVHGAAMKFCGTQKVKYGFTGLYAFACSDDYYDKRTYLFIALAPVVLWGIVLALLTIAVPSEWFWIVYFIQITNISGAAGDFFVTVKFSRLPKDILVKDSGVAMTVYAPKQQ